MIFKPIITDFGLQGTEIISISLGLCFFSSNFGSDLLLSIIADYCSSALCNKIGLSLPIDKKCVYLSQLSDSCQILCQLLLVEIDVRGLQSFLHALHVLRLVFCRFYPRGDIGQIKVYLLFHQSNLDRAIFTLLVACSCSILWIVKLLTILPIDLCLDISAISLISLVNSKIVYALFFSASSVLRKKAFNVAKLVSSLVRYSIICLYGNISPFIFK